MALPSARPTHLLHLLLVGCAAVAVLASAASPPSIPAPTTGTAVTVVPRISRVQVTSRTVPLDAAACRDLSRYFDASREVASVRAGWTWTTTSRTDGDRVEITVDPSYTLTMPRWSSRATRPPTERAAWDRLYRALARHEQGHIDIFLGLLKGLRGDLASIVRPSARAALSEIDDRLATFKSTVNRQQDDYDRRTRHGIAQGAILQCP